MSGLYLFPTILTDMVGSGVTIVLAFLSLWYAYQLTRNQPENFVWGFLFYFCIALAAFSISRAAGHIVKQLLLMTDNREMWKNIAPYSGGFNTLLMISVSAVIIYYHKGVQAFRAIEREADKLKNANTQLETAATEMKGMNLHLEEMVEERTMELSKSEKKFRHLFSNSKDMVYFCDTDQTVMDINGSGLEMLGYEVNNAPPLNLSTLFNDEDLLDFYMKTLNEQGFVNDFEVEFRKADNSILYVLLSATAVYDDDGRMIGCEVIAKDLTRVKIMMQQLVSSEKMASVGQMAAGVAHEINTPLGIILGYSQLMMDDFEKEDEVHQNLEVIERQTKACRTIVADLLKFSRQSESSKNDLDLNEVVTDVLAVIEHSLNLDHIQLEYDMVEELPLVVGDVEKLRQVFVNLVNNAHHAMEEEGGTLFVHSSYNDKAEEVEITIRDTGTGIPEDVKSRVFDPFFTTKSVGKGTGLGLSVSYGIVKDHGGTITVESPVQDSKTGEVTNGTAMHVFLPVSKESDAINQATEITPGPGTDIISKKEG